MRTVHRLGRAVSLREQTRDGPVPEIATALALMMAPRLRQWRQARADADQELTRCLEELQRTEAAYADAAQRNVATTSELAAIQDHVARAQTALTRVEAEPWRFLRFIWMWIWGAAWRKRQSAAQKELVELQGKANAIRSAGSLATTTLGELDRSRDTARRALQAAETQRQELEQLPRLVSGVAYSEYPFVFLRLQGPAADRRSTPPKRVLVTEPQADGVDVFAPEFIVPDETIRELDESLERLGTDEVLADAGEAADVLGSWGQIFGRESVLLDAVKRYEEVLSKYQPRRVTLRPATRADPAIAEVVDLTHRVGQASNLQEHFASAVDDQLEAGATVTSLISNRVVRDAQRFQRLVAGQEELLNVKQQLDDSRRESQEVTQLQLESAVRNSELTRYAFYCPLCNASPRYLEKKFGLQPDDITRQNTDSLRRALKAYQAACFNSPRGKRYDDQYRDEVEQSWSRAFDELAGLARLCAQHRSEIDRRRPPEGSPGRDVKQLERDLKAHARAYDGLIQWLLRNPLQNWLGLDPNEREEKPREDFHSGLELQTQSKLSYVPAGSGTWRCPQCQQLFSHPDARLGAIDRVRLDILYPLIHTLWNHESIWSKTVDLMKDASREMRDRLVEEVSALQPPINQFLDDTRQLRLQLQEAFAHGQATSQRLQEVAAQFSANELLDSRQLEQLKIYQDKLEEQLALVDSALEEANASENEMQQKLRNVSWERPLPLKPDRRWINADAARGLMPLGAHKEYIVADLEQG